MNTSISIGQDLSVTNTPDCGDLIARGEDHLERCLPRLRDRALYLEVIAEQKALRDAHRNRILDSHFDWSKVNAEKALAFLDRRGL